MAGQAIEVRGLDELITRMRAFPGKLAQVMAVAMSASLNTFWENVPPYPPPPETSTYRRTGTLGRTLGSSEAGGTSGGQPEIYAIRRFGSGHMEGRFGTRLEYAEYVIGEGTQARMHSGRWWTMKTIAEKAKEKINRIWQDVGNKLAAFLDGRAL